VDADGAHSARTGFDQSACGLDWPRSQQFKQGDALSNDLREDVGKNLAARCAALRYGERKNDKGLRAKRKARMPPN
jgi:hypothetical protein